MGNLAKVVAVIALQHPELDLATPICVTYQTPAHPANSLLRGILNPDQPLDLSGAQNLAESMNRRYGLGFGFPFQLDETVKPAISVLPSDQYANAGWTEGENLELPNASTCARLGIQFPLDTTDVMDARALGNFIERVAKPLNRGLEMGASREAILAAGLAGAGQQQDQKAAAAPPPVPSIGTTTAAQGPLPVGQILAGISTLAASFALLRAEVQAIRSGGSGVATSAPPTSGSNVTPPTTSAGVPSATSVGAIMGPLAASATSILADLNHQVGPSGGGHWAQLLRSLATGVQHAKIQLVP